LIGFLSGLGAASADALYGSLAAFGLAAASSLWLAQQAWLGWAGGLFLLFLGVRTFLARPEHNPAQAETSRGALGAYLSTFGLTLTNPLTILSFAAVFAGLGVTQSEQHFLSAAVLVLGVFSGSAAWWLLLSSLAGSLRKQFNIRAMRWVNRTSGLVIGLFGAAALWSALQTPLQPIQAALVAAPSTRAGVQFDPAAELQGGVPGMASGEGADIIAGFSRAAPDQPLSFPQDYGPHPDFQTEWWYYTGNLTTDQGRRFAYQLTFFRRALLPPPLRQERSSAWGTQQVYLAHFAVSDVQANVHRSFERLGRGAGGVAGASAQPFEVWLEDWQVVQTGAGQYRLQAATLTDAGEPLALDLELEITKGPILQGSQGYSQKGPESGNASYYYSFTRLATQGTVTVPGGSFAVDGFSWMDHEFSTSALAPDQVGWDWFSIQLDDGSELMVFQIRRADGSIDSFSSGTFIAPDGSTVQLKREDFTIEVLDTWTSQATGGVYPSRWQVRVESLDLTLDLQPLIADQEMDLTYTYWEGAVSILGSRLGSPVAGYGFVEMTGYVGGLAGGLAGGG
jgi:predicted secreted hydrolase/threonine/homoserine/homoserine lactone efflux protein